MTKHVPICGALVFLAACAHDYGPIGPAVDEAPTEVQAALECRVDVPRASMVCIPEQPAPAAGVAGAIVGGQDEYIFLESSNVEYAGGVFSANVTVRNLITQTLGTEDGLTPHPAGVRVFFHRLPTVTKSNGPGEVTLREVGGQVADGVATFTSANQPYYQYSQVLAPGKVSLPRTWQFEIPATVEEFTFGVYVSARVANEKEIVDGLKFRAQTIAAGSNHTCALNMTGQLYCWGRNNRGQLGSPDTTRRSTPTLVPDVADTTFAVLSAGAEHTCALTAAGKAYCWGRNGDGQVGDSTTIDRYSPTPIRSDSTFIAISAGSDHTCGVTTAGRIYCWGLGYTGQLGHGLPADRTYPVAVNDASTFVAVTTGSRHTCGLTATGKIYYWGSNEHYQLGDGTGTTRYTPVPIADTSNSTFVAVSAGLEFTCGLTTTGKVYCWGRNQYSQLGDGTTDNAPTPVAIADTSNSTFALIGTGRLYACAITTTGKGYCWGYNGSGQLGDGTTQPRALPTPLAAPAGITFTSLATGSSHACGTTSTGMAYCWGGGSTGELGNGSTSGNVYAPTQVVGVTNFAHLAPNPAAEGSPTPFPRRPFEAYAYAGKLAPPRTGNV